jgi:hypothetical protein
VKISCTQEVTQKKNLQGGIPNEFLAGGKAKHTHLAGG